MSRDIKFRAWDGKKILDGINCTFEFWNGEYDVSVPDMSAFDSRHYVRNPKPTLMQYTGLKDKNGVEIYEGDILQTKGGNFAVEWQGQGWGLSPQDRTNPAGVVGANRQSEQEVIGNIYSNPELLSHAKGN